MDCTARGSIQVEGLEMAMVKQQMSHWKQEKNKQKPQIWDISDGENVCGTMKT